MIRFLYASIFGIIVSLIQITILKILIKNDTDLRSKVKRIQKLETIIIFICQIAQECWMAILTPIKGDSLWTWASTQIFLILFIVQSYVDNKIKQVYDFLTTGVIIFESLGLIDRYLLGVYNQDFSIETFNIIPVFAILALLAIMTAFKALGAGDFLIYIALALHYVQFQEIPWFQFLVSILIGQGIFLAYNLVELLIFRKDFKENKPFTMFLQIAAVLQFA